VSDEFTVPVCRLHHRELHRNGDEAAWWSARNIDPVPIALALWQRTRAGGPVTSGIKPALGSASIDNADHSNATAAAGLQDSERLGPP
jgi:hypothetical protein